MRASQWIVLFGLSGGIVGSALSQEAMPRAHGGSCPSGYHQSGDYCTPSSADARRALPRIGSCPSGYHQSGDYCLGSSASAKPAVPRSGSCPSGYHQSGDYCLKN